MRFFSHLFYPWGFIVQIFALVHFFWRRRASLVRSVLMVGSLRLSARGGLVT